MTTQAPHLRLVDSQPSRMPFRPGDAAAALLDAPRGVMTLVNGRTVQDCGGWRAMARALVNVTTEREVDVFTYQPGSGPAHPLIGQLGELEGEFVTDVMDVDTDLRVPEPDWLSDEYETFNPDLLAQHLSPFGSGSLPRLARVLAAEEHMSGMLPLLVVDPGTARPYAGIVRRLADVPDRRVRDAAKVAVLEWLADDAAAFAAARPDAVTVVISDDRKPEWAALLRRAGTVPIR